MRVTINDINIEQVTDGRIVEGVDKLIETQYLKWNNQKNNLWPKWFARAVKGGGFLINGVDLYLVTDEGDCGSGRYLIDQGDYAVKEVDGSYSSRNRWVMENRT